MKYTFDELSQRYGEQYKWMALMILAAGTVAGVLCISSFNVAIPALSRRFNLGQNQVQWVMTGFLAAMTISMLPTSWLLDRLGFRMVFLVALLTLLFSSLAGFFAPSFSLVVLARILQGAATGVLQPMGPLALMRLFPSAMQGRASGILIFSIVLPPAMAPSLGGLLLDRFGWEYIFLLGVPFAFAAALAAIYLLPIPRVVAKRSFDWTGLIIITIGILSMIEAASSLRHIDTSSIKIEILIASTITSITFDMQHAKRRDSPIISKNLFIGSTFSLGTLVSFVYGFGLYGSIYLIPAFLQKALSYSATESGAALLPSGIALVLMLPLAGWMSDNLPPKWVMIAGLMIFSMSFLTFSALGVDIAYAEIIAATVIGRLGLGMIMPALNLATLRHLDSHQLGQASVVVSFARQLGGVLGVAIMAAFTEWREMAYSTVSTGIFSAYIESFLALSAVLATATVFALFMKLKPPLPVIHEN